MVRPARLAVAALAVSLTGAIGALAETKVFNAPVIRGVRLDWCAHFGRDCGRPAAELFCRELGFTQAVRFAIDPGAGARSGATLVFGDGRLCQGPQCAGFAVIACARPDVRAAPVAPAPPTLLTVPPPATVGKPPFAVAPLKPVPPAAAAPPPKTPAVPKAGSRVGPAPALTLTPPAKPPGSRTGSAQTPATAAAAPPVLVLPGGASLYQCLRSDCEFQVTYDFKIDPRAPSQSGHFGADVGKVPNATRFRWQVATRPYPPFASGAPADLQPPGLAAEGDSDLPSRRFSVDFAKVAAALPPGADRDSFYVRILPLAKGKTTVVGQPSNVIRVYYGGSPPPQAPITFYDFSPPRLFTVRIVSFTPPDFQNPNRWGCVVIKGHKGPVGSLIRDAFPVGKEICPKSFEGGSGQITSFGEFVDWAAGGIVDAIDWVSEAYADLKDLAIDIVMKYTLFGAQCEWLVGALDKGSTGYCRVAAEAAVNAGLVALGVPPTLPNYNELIDKGVDHAVALAAAEVAKQTGVPCIGPCEEALRDAFSAAAEGLKKASYAPGCVGKEEAHKHGREPLCLPDSIIARPARGAVYTPPSAVVEVTRLSADRPVDNHFDGSCHLGVGFRVDNRFPGATVFGPGTSPETKEIPPQKISGTLFAGDGMTLAETIAKGTTLRRTFVFEKPQPFIFSWTKQLWRWSQIPPRDEVGPMGPDWFMLYSGGTAIVTASVNCAAGGSSAAYALPRL